MTDIKEKKFQKFQRLTYLISSSEEFTSFSNDSNNEKYLTYFKNCNYLQRENILNSLEQLEIEKNKTDQKLREFESPAHILKDANAILEHKKKEGVDMNVLQSKLKLIEKDNVAVKEEEVAVGRKLVAKKEEYQHLKDLETKIKNHRFDTKNLLKNILERLNICTKSEKIAVAVGGSKASFALCLLLKDLIGKDKFNAFVIDANIDERSSKIFTSTINSLAEMDISYKTLPINHTNQKALNKIQCSDALKKKSFLSNFSTERNALLARMCEKEDITSLFFCQTLEDQLVSSIGRFFKGSGVYGLAGYKSVEKELNTAEFGSKFVKVVRPLLHIPQVKVDEIITFNNVNRCDLAPLKSPAISNIFFKVLETKLQNNELSDFFEKKSLVEDENPLSKKALSDFVLSMSLHKKYMTSNVKGIIEKNLKLTPEMGSCFLKIDASPNNYKTHWISNPFLGNKVLDYVVHWTDRFDKKRSPLSNVNEARLQIVREVNFDTHTITPTKKPRLVSLSRTIFHPPRSSNTGRFNWLVFTEPFKQKDIKDLNYKVKFNEINLWDKRFYLIIKNKMLETNNNKISSILYPHFNKFEFDQCDVFVKPFLQDDLQQIISVLKRLKKNEETSKIYSRLSHYARISPPQARGGLPCFYFHNTKTKAANEMQRIIIGIPSLKLNFFKDVFHLNLSYKKMSTFNRESLEKGYDSLF
ncbi:hypothetical protein HDU92_003053 [Lobulomyces angularis]|nr:hypothetical protein HDU92_003053 [Lobulomyces angularis]